MMKLIRFILIFSFFLTCSSAAFCYNTFSIEHEGEEQVVHYDLFVPEVEQKGRLPVLICVGGLPVIDGEYVHSNPSECMTEVWKDFAKEHQMAILGVGYLFKPRDWENQTSYQYAEVWSGKALKQILKTIAKEHPIHKKKLYFFGISAGAQFAVRYAFYDPKSVKAVAAHAAGGFDEPNRKIKTKFLLTVGAQDNKEINRVQWAQFFLHKAKERDIDVKAVLFPLIGHWQTEPQNELSRQFFTESLAKKR